MENPRRTSQLVFGGCALFAASLATALGAACAGLTLDSPLTFDEGARVIRLSGILIVGAAFIQIGAAWMLNDVGLTGPLSSRSKILRFLALSIGLTLCSWMGGFVIFFIASNPLRGLAWHIVK
jgi:hypothetical protein